MQLCNLELQYITTDVYQLKDSDGLILLEIDDWLLEF